MVGLYAPWYAAPAAAPTRAAVGYAVPSSTRARRGALAAHHCLSLISLSRLVASTSRRGAPLGARRGAPLGARRRTPLGRDGGWVLAGARPPPATGAAIRRIAAPVRGTSQDPRQMLAGTLHRRSSKPFLRIHTADWSGKP